MRVLELFSGTGSIGRAFQALGWGVVSLDIDPSCNPTHAVCILSFDFRAYPRDHFNFVWASPVCTHYSVARTTGGPRDLPSADRLVQRTLEVVEYFGCHFAFENPQSGLLKTRAVVSGIPFVDTSYCRYGYPYRKTTRIWSSLAPELARRLRPPCSLKNPCTVMVGKRHPKTAQQSRRSCDRTDTDNTCSRAQLYSIPADLCEDIAAEVLVLTQSHAVADSPNAGADVQAPGTFISEVL